jgi:chromosome segregation protein
MHLKRLELSGYKTFASRTEFVFNGGITAIVGPNGSGKSNVADAVRWVLGEQSFSLLRAKKTEDMIFSGSERRSRMGMAEATIILDNEEGWLPVDFSEVSITRRSYRSGENEYWMNGSKVRLRDIADLLGKSGLSRRTYAVVGQGLIDAALSLRPEERRGLIEEASGLSLYQSRRASALGRLEETRQNVLRVHDLIAEIAPRLKRLEGQAERAREYGIVRAELDAALRVWYSYQWQRGQDELLRRRRIAEYQAEQLDAQRAHAREMGRQIAVLRARQGELRRQLSQWHRESSALHAESEARQRDLAVAEERRRLLIQGRDEAQSGAAPLEASRARQQEQIAAARADLSALLETLGRQRAAVEAAQAAVEERQSQVNERLAAQTEAQRKLIDLRTHIADRQSRLVQLGERRGELLEASESHQAAGRSLEDRIGALDRERAALTSKLQEADDAVRRGEGQFVEQQQRIAAAQQQQRELQERRNQLDQRWGRLRERYDLLARMREEGAGLYDGVRSVLRATRDRGGRLEGIVGTIAELIRVPPELETAVEVALGGQLQDIVVRSWQDAQAAIEHLKRTRGGRATFLPLDTLRTARPIRVPQIEGVVGVASTLVECDDRVRPVADYLLGRTIVCQDLPIARRVLQALQGSYQIVTPEGEVVRSSGALTGGAGKRQRQGGVLAREREWRELPARLGELEREREALVEAIHVLDSEERAWREELAVLAARQKELAAERLGREQELGSLQRQIGQVEQEREWHRALAGESERDLAALGTREAELERGLAALQAQAVETEAQIEELAQRLDQAEDRELEAQLAERRAEMSLAQQERASKQATLEGYQQSLRQIEAQIADRRRRAEELAGQLAQTERRIQELREQESALGVQIQAYAERIEPVEQELETLETQQARVEEQESGMRGRLQSLESRHSQTQVEVARQEDHMNDLRRQIKEDLGMVELDAGGQVSGQPLLPLAPLVSSLPEVKVLPEGLEEQIRALKRRLRRLEPVNLEAPAEYEEVRQRHEFLSTQAQDLEQGSAHLREVIAELDAVMEREFKRTFDAVAREFRRYFDKLFGGGSARLQLTDPDDVLNTGIEVVARPPGKRQQGLALLSGGERALTAAALIFAILTVSPPPFCVLDEVDAALDEANVGRFRAVLKELSEEMQFVVITHNRYTIEIANTLYGISMAGDGTSCVLSRQMGADDDRDQG